MRRARYFGRYLTARGGGAPASLADQWPSPLTPDLLATASSSRTTVTAAASATPHTEGSWVEVDASLAADAYGIQIVPTAAVSLSGNNSSTLLEIGTGAGGAETVWATVAVGYYIASSLSQPFTVPGFIAAGTRVAVRLRSAVASQSFSPLIHFLSGSGKGVAPGAPVTMGVDTATSKGVSIAAPGALNTKGAWTEIEDATAFPFGALVVCPQADGGTGMSATGVLVDVGIGAAAAEAVLIGDIYLGGQSIEQYTRPNPLTYGVTIPAGSRLSVRYARANAGNALDCFLVGTRAA